MGNIIYLLFATVRSKSGVRCIIIFTIDDNALTLMIRAEVLLQLIVIFPIKDSSLTLGVTWFVAERGWVHIRVSPGLLVPGCKIAVKGDAGKVEERRDQKHSLPFVSSLKDIKWIQKEKEM